MKYAVNNPDYYGGKENPYEAIKIILRCKLDFCLGNSVKYILRAGKKNPEKEIEDLEKAKWYLQCRINELELSKINLNEIIKEKHIDYKIEKEE